MPHATILYVEDNHLVAGAVRGLLEAGGWSVEWHAAGGTAISRLAGAAPYDLLLFGDDLPGMTGVELAQCARDLPRYRSTPIILLSAGDCRAEAMRAGADEFLRKPEDVGRLVAVVASLLAAKR
ncbi:MAG TPA: response regulator [Pyrinomonadaceae bacterium]|jgi:two-component system chemotaxis response regulator CheY